MACVSTPADVCGRIAAACLCAGASAAAAIRETASAENRYFIYYLIGCLGSNRAGIIRTQSFRIVLREITDEFEVEVVHHRRCIFHKLVLELGSSLFDLVAEHFVQIPAPSAFVNSTDFVQDELRYLIAGEPLGS